MVVVVVVVFIVATAMTVPGLDTRVPWVVSGSGDQAYHRILYM